MFTKNTLNMKQKLILVLCCSALLKLNAYTPNISNFYTMYKQYYNPALAGIGSKSDITLLGQYQFFGYDDQSPFFQNTPYSILLKSKPINLLALAGNTNIKLKNKHSLGLGFTNQFNQNQLLKFNHLRINANWQYAIKETKKISIGVGFSNYTHVFSQKEYFRVYNMPNFENINNKTTHNVNIDAGAAYINTKNNFYIGIAVLDIYKHKYFTFGKPEIAVEESPFFNYTFSTGIDIKLSEKWIAKPHTIVRRNGGLTEMVLGTTANYKNKFNFGVNYNNKDNWDYLFLSSGYQLKTLSINYGYNLPLSRILSLSSGTHYLGLQYAF